MRRFLLGVVVGFALREASWRLASWAADGDLPA
jgi:hypothetical protein